MVVVPLFASDQFVDAGRVQEGGAGVALDGGEALASLGEAVRRVLADPSYRRGAGEVAAELAALPPVSSCVALVEGPR